MKTRAVCSLSPAAWHSPRIDKHRAICLVIRPTEELIWDDDIGQSDLSVYSKGLTGHKTPSIDRIVDEGMVFADCYGEQSSTAGRSLKHAAVSPANLGAQVNRKGSYNSQPKAYMNTEDAKDFLADQAAQQAALDHITISDLEKRMMYFSESDPASCDDPVRLDDEFEEKYATAEYEAKMSRLLHRAYKRLKVENPAGKLHWDEAISTLEKGDHYILVLWGQHSPMGARKDGPGSKVVKYGGMFVAGCLLLAKLANDRRIPTWVFEFFGVLLLVLFLLTMFFLAQQGYWALRRRKSS